MFRLIDITIDITFFSINWKNYFDPSILAISMTVLLDIIFHKSHLTLGMLHVSK